MIVQNDEFLSLCCCISMYSLVAASFHQSTILVSIFKQCIVAEFRFPMTSKFVCSFISCSFYNLYHSIII
jgi:hypothetical protein